jgi:hypothetical protein
MHGPSYHILCLNINFLRAPMSDNEVKTRVEKCTEKLRDYWNGHFQQAASSALRAAVDLQFPRIAHALTSSPVVVSLNI